MKLKILFFLYIIFFITPAVSIAETKLALGVQGGATFPNYKFKNTSLSSEYGNRNGRILGVFGEIGFSTLTLRPEINHVTKTYTVANTVDVKNSHLEVPILLKFNPFGSFVVSPFLLVGPQWSKYLKTETTFLGSTASYNNTADDWDLAAVGGAGLEFNILPLLVFNLQGRYVYGFRDIDKSNTEVKTRAFYAMAGLGISI